MNYIKRIVDKEIDEKLSVILTKLLSGKFLES